MAQDFYRLDAVRSARSVKAMDTVVCCYFLFSFVILKKKTGHLYSIFLWEIISKALRMGRVNEVPYHTVLPATHTFIHEWNKPSCLYSQPQCITALWLVLVCHPVVVSGWVGLGSWLHTKMVPRPQMVTHPSTNRPIVRWLGIELTTVESQVWRPNY